jgi:predicted amidohydrolase YtcJ
MQSVHCTSDAPYVPKRLGDKRAAEGAYMWKAFLNAGVVVTNGTDVPVEDVNPLLVTIQRSQEKQKPAKPFTLHSV